MSLKHFIIFFSIFFVIFSVIGYKNGSDDVKSPEFLKIHIFSKFSKVQINETEYLAYKKGEDTLLMFNIDSNKLIPIDKEFFLNRNNHSIPDKNLLSYLNSTVYTAFGAGALGYSIKDLFKSAESIRGQWQSAKGKGTILGIILGSISGYSFGYWIATNTAIPSEDSKEYTNILLSQDKWIEAKKTIFADTWHKTKSLIPLIKNKKLSNEFYQEKSVFVKGWKFDSSNELVINSSLFEALIKFHIKVEQAYDKESSKPTVVDNIFKVALWTLYLCGVGLLIFGVGLPRLMAYYKKEKLKRIGQPKNISDSISLLSTYLSDKEKAEYKAMTEKEFSENNYKLKDTIHGAWNLGWEYLDDNKKNNITKPIILEQFSNSGLKYSWDVEKVILQSFHRSLLDNDIDIEGQIKTLIEENNERQKKRNASTP